MSNATQKIYAVEICRNRNKIKTYEFDSAFKTKWVALARAKDLHEKLLRNGEIYDSIVLTIFTRQYLLQRVAVPRKDSFDNEITKNN